MTTRLFGKTEDHRKAQSGTAVDLFRRKERFECLFPYISRHTDTIIRNRQQHVLSDRQFSLCGHVFIIEPGIRCFDRQSPPGRHRVPGIQAQVQQRTFNLSRIRLAIP